MSLAIKHVSHVRDGSIFLRFHALLVVSRLIGDVLKKLMGGDVWCFWR